MPMIMIQQEQKCVAKITNPGRRAELDPKALRILEYLAYVQQLLVHKMEGQDTCLWSESSGRYQGHDAASQNPASRR